MKTICNNNKGMALAYVIIVMAVLAILGAVVLTVSLAETKFSVTSERNLQADYIAKAGADIAADYMKNNPGAGNTTITDTLGEGSFTAVITTINAGTAKVEATGTVDNAVKKVSLLLKKGTYQSLFTGIRQTGSAPLDLGQFPITYPPGTSVSIEANVSTLADITLASENADDFAAGNITKAINTELLPPFTVPNTAGFQTALPADKQLIGDYKITGTLGGGYTFNTQGGDQQIVVDKIDFQNDIFITGGGFVHLYINGTGVSEVKLPHTMVNPTNTAKLIIYVRPGATLSFAANCEAMSAYIYGPGATIEVQSAQTIIHGAIIGNLIQRNNSNGPHGGFNFIPLADNPDTSAINTPYQKAMYVK